MLVAAVSAAAPKPVVVVVMSAVPLDLSSLMKNPRVGAILYVGQPSVQCLGVGDVLFGKVAAVSADVLYRTANTVIFVLYTLHTFPLTDFNTCTRYAH